MHLSESFASHASSALKVRLVLREEHRPPRQRPLLEDPTPLVQRALQDVAAEVVDGLAYVEVLNTMSEGEVLSLQPVLEKPVVLARGPAGGQDAIRTAEHVLHVLGLLAKVTVVSLDNADRVDPEIANSESSCRVHGILEGGRQLIIGNPLQEGRELASLSAAVLSQRAERGVLGRISPRVGEGNVPGVSRLVLAGLQQQEPRLCTGSNIDQPGRQVGFCRALTIGVITVAILQPEMDQLEEGTRSRLRELGEAQLNGKWWLQLLSGDEMVSGDITPSHYGACGSHLPGLRKMDRTGSDWLPDNRNVDSIRSNLTLDPLVAPGFV